MTDEELIAKFRYNAIGVLPDNQASEIVAQIMALEQVVDVSALMSLARN